MKRRIASRRVRGWCGACDRTVLCVCRGIARAILALMMFGLGACASDVVPLVPANLPSAAVAGLPLRMGAKAVTNEDESERTFVRLPADVLPICIHVANDASASAVWLDAESLRLLGAEPALADAGIDTPSMTVDVGAGVLAGLVPITAPAIYWFLGQQHADSGVASVQAMRYRLETQVLEPASRAVGCAYFRLPQRVAPLEACVTMRPSYGLHGGAPVELCAGVDQ